MTKMSEFVFGSSVAIGEGFYFGGLGVPGFDYSVNGFNPELVADMSKDYYRSGGATTTSDDLFTHTRNGNATMVDSDGLLKWGPHNLLTYSEQFDNAAWTKFNTSVTANAAVAPDGTQTANLIQATSVSAPEIRGITLGGAINQNDKITFSVWLKSNEGDGLANQVAIRNLTDAINPLSIDVNLTDGSFTYLTGSSGATVTGFSDGWWLVELTYEGLAGKSYRGSFGALGTLPSLPSSVYAWGAHVYRSDLGGMVNNPDRGDSYVPTTSSAVYLPRRGHHVYNGSAWVNKGLLVESEARTNLLTYSEDFTNASWLTGGLNSVVSSNTSISPDGNTNAETLSVDSVGGATGTVGVAKAITVSTSTAYTASVFAKADQSDFLALGVVSLTTPANGNVWFDLVNGSVGTSDTGLSGTIKDFGDGWYRCSITFTTDAADTSGQLRIYLGNTDGGASITRDGTSSILIYGAQIEAGSTPSSYIPTSGATVTRAAETLTVPAANLPWPSPVVIGDELVTNGTFDSDTDWTKGAGWTISGGVASFSNPTGTSLDQTGLPTMFAGRVYMLTFDMNYTSGAGCTVGINVGGGIDTFGAFNGTATHTAFVVPTVNRSGISITGIGTSVFYIDNISVKEINPLSVSIQMQGEMTYAEVTDGNNVVPFRWHIDNNNRIIDRLSVVSGSDTGQFIFQQTNSGTNDEVGSGANTYSPGVNVPFNIASRHGSTFINGAVDGTALTADTTPVALPDLSSTDLQLGYDYMGTISLFRIWADDLGDAGIAEASA
jgi:hypothetical protein